MRASLTGRDHTSATMALMLSSVGIALCFVLAFAARLPEPALSLDPWNHWRKVSMFEEPKPDDGSIQITVKYKIDPAKESEFLDAIHDYERIRRRDGAFRWDIFYDAEIPGMYLETFRVDSWGERERQHDRFTVADRECEERVLRFTLAPVKTRHFLYADRIEQQGDE